MTSALYLQIEPINRLSASDKRCVAVYPQSDGEGRHTYNEHPERTIATAVAGDVIVHNGQRFRLTGVKLVGEWKGPWFRSVAECLSALMLAES
jgi:hypothetical protein